MPNITVNLKDAAWKITSATTNDIGRYTFSGNIPGMYTLRPENTQPYIFPYSEEVEVTTSNVNVDFSGINLETVEDDATAELLRQSAESDELIFKWWAEEDSWVSDWIKSILKGSPNGQNGNNAGQTAALSEWTTGNSFANIFETNSLFKLLSEGYLPLTNTYSPIPLSLLERFGDTSTICGNGTVESGETCDDGINNGTEGLCSSDCLYIGEVRYTGEEVSGLESSVLSDSLEVSLEAYQEVGDMVSGVVDTWINFVEDATGVIGEIYQNIVSEPFQSAGEFLKETLIENTSPEVRAIIAQTGEVAQEVGKYTVIGATWLLWVTAVSLNILVFKSMWTTYTVLEWDTLSSIGSQFTMTERAMRARNGLWKGKRLRPGMKIRVRNRHFIEKDYLDQLKSVLKDELTKRNHGKMADKIDKLFAKK